MLSNQKDENSQFGIRFEKTLQNQQALPSQINVPMSILACIFKILVIIIYFALGSFQILDFCLVVLLTSIDFWVTKNLTGRKLAGLCWWVQYRIESQQQYWVFQSISPARRRNNFNETIFWSTMSIFTVFSLITLMIHLMSMALFWIGLSGFISFLNVINFHCFYKCKGKHQEKVLEFVSKFGSSQIQSHQNIIQQEAAETQY